ncbi:MAG: DNA-packaging protein [Alphaproteobacteria bacterium]
MGQQNLRFNREILKLLEAEKKRRETEKLKHNWQLQARTQQRIPQGDWRIWLILAGRGFGKTRTGAETVRRWATQGIYQRICLLANNFDDGRKVMLEGQSGLLSISPEDEQVRYQASRRMLAWPGGAKAFLYSAQAPHQLRGPQFDAAWIDELAKFPNVTEVWDQLMFSLRLGNAPRILITTTPRPLRFLKELMERDDVYITTGTTFENAENLAEGYLDMLKQTYLHTRLGLQEIEGKYLEEAKSDALWREEFLSHITCSGPAPPLKRIVVAIDPATTNRPGSDETGIIVAGLDGEGKAYVLEDLSGKLSATQWGLQAVEAYHRHKADRILAEVNNGGDLVEKLIHSLDASVAFKAVRATRGKSMRAEPVVALYEQKKVFHLKHFPKLVEQMLTYTPNSSASPDRLDALVWALTELCLGKDQKGKNSPAIRKIWSV